MPYIVRALQRKKMLPAILFIFSRAGCDQAAQQAAESCSNLLTASEAMEVSERIKAWRERHTDLPVDEDRLALLHKGVASHHAGMLPLEKSLIESLFQDALIKAVFATETLAAGVNMPARCTVITVISKRGDNGIATLAPSAFLQMAGRAGRRGKDDLGHVVVCRSPFEDASAAHQLLLQPPEQIRSHFYVTYGSALQMLRTRELDECKQLVERSFGSFLASAKERVAGRAEAEAAEALQKVEALLADYSEEELAAYIKLQVGTATAKQPNSSQAASMTAPSLPSHAGASHL